MSGETDGQGGQTGQTGQTGTTLTNGSTGGGQTGQSGQTGQTGQTGQVDWSTHIPKELAGEKVWEPLKGKPLGDVLKGYHEAQKMIGSTIRVPKEDAKPEEWEAFYTKLGRPEKPEKYDLKAEDGNRIDKTVLDAFRQIAHENGLTTKQAQAMLDTMNDIDGIKAREAEKTLANDLAALKEEWGGAFDRKIVLAQRAVKEFAGPDMVKMLNDSGLGNHPAMIRFMAAIGDYLAEDGTISGDVRGSGSKEDALAKIKAINNDMKHPYWNEGPGHKEAVEDMKRLSKIAYS